jgi:mono/diheme cytochrome c family protein
MADCACLRRPRLGVVFFIVTIALLLTACGGSNGSDSGSNSNSIGAGEAAVSEAQALFIEVGCAECHGEQGEGVDGKARSLQGKRMLYDQFSRRVRNGRGSAMPAYTVEEISDEQVMMLHEWLSTQ